MKNKIILASILSSSLLLLSIASYAATNSNQGNIEKINLVNKSPYTLVYRGQTPSPLREKVTINMSRIPPGGQAIITGISLNFGKMPFKQIVGSLYFDAINSQGKIISHDTFMINDQPQAHSQAPVNQFMRHNNPAKGQLISQVSSRKWDKDNSPFALQLTVANVNISALN